MQSKFWAAGSESSDSEFSSSDSDDGRDVEATKRAIVPSSRWAVAESSSSEDEGRVVKSLKDRRWSAMREIIRQMENHIKICDFAELYKDYDQLVRALQKSPQLVAKEGVPNFFIKQLVTLEAFLEEKHKDKEYFKKLSKAKALALNTLRAKVRKTNEVWAEKVEECKAHPEDFETQSEDEQSADDQDSDSDFSEDSDASSSEGEDEDYSQEESGTDWSDSEVEQESSGDDVDRHKVAMAKWGIREDSKKSSKTTGTSKRKVKKEKIAKEPVVAESMFTMKDMENLFDTTDVNDQVMRKRIQIVVERRGRRGVDRHEQTNILKKLVEIAETIGPQCQLEVMGQLISAEFDITTGAFTCLSSSIWLETFSHVSQVLDILLKHPETHLVPLLSAEESDQSNAAQVSACILASFVERLDEELIKSLQLTDVHSDEYKDRLGHTIDMLALCWRAFCYIDSRSFKEQASSMALKINEHMHYKHDSVALRMWELTCKKLDDEYTKELPNENITPSSFVEKNTRYIFLNSTSNREKVRTLLHVAYSKSLHDEYYESRDLLLTPNVQELASQIDIPTQILYNRSLAQLGLCAFRKGLIADAFACLTQICPKHKELLAQGISHLKIMERTPEQERLEKRRLLPYHMHISMELIEGAHNVCAMLLEVPQMARETIDSRKRIICKHFRRMVELYERQPYPGPPENAREIVMAASKALQRGAWQECCKYILNLNTWEKVMNPGDIREMLKLKIKREAMRTYILTYLTFYDSFAIEQLCSMFELSRNDVHSIVSKMMINEEIHASWDESSCFIIMSRIDQTRLQQLALTLAENVANAVEQNELTLNMKNPKFALAHERRFQARDGDRYGWGNREREEYSGNRGRGNRNRGFINPVVGRGARGGRGGRGRFSNYQDNPGYSRDDRSGMRIKFGTNITYS